jgi:hypothetical protein
MPADAGGVAANLSLAAIVTLLSYDDADRPKALLKLCYYSVRVAPDDHAVVRNRLEPKIGDPARDNSPRDCSLLRETDANLSK